MHGPTTADTTTVRAGKRQPPRAVLNPPRAPLYDGHTQTTHKCEKVSPSSAPRPREVRQRRSCEVHSSFPKVYMIICMSSTPAGPHQPPVFDKNKRLGTAFLLAQTHKSTCSPRQKLLTAQFGRGRRGRRTPYAPFSLALVSSRTARLFFTPSASRARTDSVSSQPIHASVMLTPY